MPPPLDRLTALGLTAALLFAALWSCASDAERSLTGVRFQVKHSSASGYAYGSMNGTGPTLGTERR